MTASQTLTSDKNTLNETPDKTVLSLRKQGLSIRKIADQTGIDKSKVHRMLHNSKFIQQETITPIPESFEAFNALIGYPRHPKSKELTPLYQYQTDLLSLIDDNSWVLINKSRKIGVSEIILRIIAFKCFNSYEGSQIMLVAGNRIQHARRLMRRFQRLFDNIRDHVEHESSDYMKLTNNTEVFAFPSNDTALRGLENVICVFLDEASHFNVIDDTDVYNALEPNLVNTSGDFIIVSTPNGKRGMFYDLWQDKTNQFYKHEMPWHVSKNLLINERMIDRKKNDMTIDFEQEYLCQFTSPKGSFISEDLIMVCEDNYELETI